MKYFSVALLLGLAGCSYTPSDTVITSLSKEFDLHAGQQATIGSEHFSITFLNVVEDSRCPDNARCIWAGNGEIAVRVNYVRLAPLDTTLNTYLQPHSVSFGYFTIELLKLSPYPHAPTTIDPDDYVATLKVVKNE